MDTSKDDKLEKYIDKSKYGKQLSEDKIYILK